MHDDDFFEDSLNYHIFFSIKIVLWLIQYEEAYKLPTGLRKYVKYCINWLAAFSKSSLFICYLFIISVLVYKNKFRSLIVALNESSYFNLPLKKTN